MTRFPRDCSLGFTIFRDVYEHRLFQRGMKGLEGGNAPEDSSSEDPKCGPTRASSGCEEEALILPRLCVGVRREHRKLG